MHGSKRFAQDLSSIQSTAKPSPSMSGAISQHCGPRAVREHPAKKLHVESQGPVPDLLLGFEPAGLEQAARELAGAGDGGLLAVADMERGGLQGHHAARAHAVQGRDFAGWATRSPRGPCWRSRAADDRTAPSRPPESRRPSAAGRLARLHTCTALAAISAFENSVCCCLSIA